MSDYSNTALPFGGDLSSSETGELDNDIADPMIASELPQRRVRRRLDGGDNLLNASVIQNSEQSTEEIDMGNVPTSSNFRSRGLDSPTAISRWFWGRPRSSTARVSVDDIYFQIYNKTMYRFFQTPRMTISHAVNCFPMEDLTRNVDYGWRFHISTNEEIRLRLETNIRIEEAGISEDKISSRLRTRVYAPSANGLRSKGSTSSIDKQESCSICMEKYQTNDSIAELYYCEHDFHADCIKKWLKEKNTCPMCRSLAIIPPHFPDWTGDLRFHRAFFKRL